jgi:hypothetical protein
MQMASARVPTANASGTKKTLKTAVHRRQLVPVQAKYRLPNR